MSIYVAFLRAVNVAGHGTLEMTDLSQPVSSKTSWGVAATSRNWVDGDEDRCVAASANRRLGPITLAIFRTTEILLYPRRVMR
jgi:hypothetical protein